MDAAWVWPTRWDRGLKAIFRAVARQTKVYHATGSKDDAHFSGNVMKGYDRSYNKAAEYRFGAILSCVNAIHVENLAWEHFFEFPRYRAASARL